MIQLQSCRCSIEAFKESSWPCGAWYLINRIWSWKGYLASEHQQGMDGGLELGLRFPSSLWSSTLLSVTTVLAVVLQRSTSGSGGFGLSHRKYLHGEATTWRAAECQFRRVDWLIHSNWCHPLLSKVTGAWMEPPYLLIRGIGTAMVLLKKK